MTDQTNDIAATLRLSGSLERSADAGSAGPGAQYEAAGLSWDYMSPSGIMVKTVPARGTK